MRGIGFDGRLAIGETMIYNRAKKRFSVFPFFELSERDIYYSQREQRTSTEQIDSDGKQHTGHFFRGIISSKEHLSVKL